MTHASVFSGIGGPEVAAAMLGWENLFHCEINPFGRAVLQYWFPNAKSYEDITKTDFSEWGGRVNVLTGGFPCQPFSYAGQRRGANDDRYLWPYMHRCINQVRPDWVVCENVAGILTMVEQGDVTEMETEKSLFDEGDTLHRYRLDETFTLERICNDLESDGYAVQAVVIPACAVNAPHRRDRVFIIGHRIVADTDNGANGRTARKNEAKGGEEWLQERHEVREPDQPNQIRPTAEGYVPDSIRKGLEGKDQPRCGKGGERLHLRRDPARCHRQDDAEWATPNPDCDGQRSCGRPSGRAREKMDSRGAGKPFNGIERLGASRPVADPACNRSAPQGESSTLNGTRPDKFPCQARQRERHAPIIHNGLSAIPRDAADTKKQCCQRDGLEQSGTGREKQEQFGGRSVQDCGIAGCGRWQWSESGKWLPTVSPVHRGNDGFPFPLDDLTISPSKWRTESLKAYGNAIVPQVMYEIFKAIEETYQ